MELVFDVFNELNQLADVASAVTIDELINEIVTEFDLDINQRDSYALYRLGQDRCLKSGLTVQECQLLPKDRLVFGWKSQPPALGRISITDAPQFALRELSTGRVINIEWFPAIIGRFDHGASDNGLILVDAIEFIGQKGARVSRRHAQITYRHNSYWIRGLTKTNVTKVDDRALEFGLELKLEHRSTVDLADGALRLEFRALEEKGNV